jgi:rhodanese-related sulfurtransferase
LHLPVEYSDVELLRRRERAMPNRRHALKNNPSQHASQHRHGVRRRNLTPLWIGLAVLLVIGAAFLLFRPQSGLPSEVQATQAYDLYQKGALFLDVRTQQEWDQGHIARSTLIPLDALPARINELPKDKDIVVVCRSGARSKEGTTLLRQAGFTRVTCLTGGLQAWVAAGYPLTN